MKYRLIPFIDLTTNKNILFLIALSFSVLGLLHSEQVVGDQQFYFLGRPNKRALHSSNLEVTKACIHFSVSLREECFDLRNVSKMIK